MPTQPTRRAVLGALGLSGAASASGDKDHDDEKRKCHGYRGRVCTDTCDDQNKRKTPCRHGEKWYDGTIVMQNCSTEEWAKARINVTGRISDIRCAEGCESSEFPSYWDLTLFKGEKGVLWFTGSIDYFEIKDGDVNMAITQRSGHHDCD